VKVTDFQEDPLNGRRNIAKKVLCFPSKVPSIVDHGHRVLDVEFQENSLNGRQDTVERVLSSNVKYPSL
jgi:hypothetical protein